MTAEGERDIDELGATAMAASTQPPSAGKTRPEGTAPEPPAGLEARAGAGGTVVLGDPSATDRMSASGPRSTEETPVRPFGPFTKIERLAEQGAMGVVARGYNAAFDRWELLKFLKREHASLPELLRQFQREGRILAKLSHPNVVTVFAVYEEGGRPCLAMEFLEGESLEALVRRAEGKLPIAQVQELFLEAARGLAAAHDVGLLHRDLKPANLFVAAERKGAPGGLKLIDFGLATADKSRKEIAQTDPSLVAALSGGTPLYMAPELWRGEDACPESDVFALGMAFHVALTGRLPYEPRSGADVLAALTSADEFPDPRALRGDTPPPLADVLRRAIAKRKEDRFPTADALVAALVAASTASRPRRIPGSGPYRGLAPFSASERDVFFGRDAEVAEVLERLRDQAGVLLVGPSGSGKSSLLHAGVVPAVEDGALGGGVVFTSVRLEPRTHPQRSLAAALSRAMGTPEAELVAFLARTPDRLGQALRQTLGDARGVIIVVDQLEELATLAEDAREVLGFAAAIASLVDVVSPGVRLVATMRADLLDRLFPLEPLRPLLTRGFYPVRPLLGAALRRAIEEPARAAGFSLEDPSVVDGILADAARTPAALPLISFAMDAWWAARDESRKLLPSDAFRALGGLGGALARHADSVLDTMGAEECREAEHVLTRLVSADGTRMRATRVALLDPAAAGPSAARALDKLLAAKVVLESGGEVELVHEALITRWPRLVKLLSSSGEDRAFRERVAAAAREWDGQGRPDGMLWTDDQAARLLRWLSTTTTAIGQTELAFVDAVRRRETRRRTLTRIFVTATVLTAVVLALTSKTSEREMEAKLRETLRGKAEAEAAFKKAESGRQRAIAESHVMDDPGAALRAATESWELSNDRTLDPLAWRARATGVAIPLPAHPGGVTHVRVAPGGAWIATAGADGAVHVLATMTPDHASFAASKEKDAAARSVAFSPSGGELVVGTTAGEVVVARAPQFAAQIVARCGGSVEGAAFHQKSLLVRCARTPADRERGRGALVWIDPEAHTTRDVASGVVAWSVAERADVGVLLRDGEKPLAFTPSTGAPGAELDLAGTHTAIAVGPAGDDLLVGEDSGVVRVVPFAGGKAGKPHALPDPHRGAVLVLRHAERGSVFSIGKDRAARLWTDERDRLRATDLGGVAFSLLPSRHAVALSAPGNDVVLLSTFGGDPLARLVGATAEITSVEASPDGRFLVTGSRDGGARAYLLDDAGPLVTRAALPEPQTSCAVSVDGAATACASAKAITVAPVAGSVGGPKEPRSLDVKGATAVAISPRGEHVAAVAAGALSIDGKPETSLVPSPVRVAYGPEGTLVVLSPSAVEVRPPVGAPWKVDVAGASLVAFARDGRVFVATPRGDVHALAGGTSAPPIAFAKLEGDARVLSVSDDGSSIAVGGASGRILVSRGGAEPKLVLRLRTAPTTLTWSGEGTALLATSVDRHLTAVDVETGAHFWGTVHAVPISAARSPIGDRFSFVAEGGACWVRALDLSPVTATKPPESALGPHAARVAEWRGLPFTR